MCDSRQAAFRTRALYCAVRGEDALFGRSSWWSEMGEVRPAAQRAGRSYRSPVTVPESSEPRRASEPRSLGRFVAIDGPNGAGKTVIARAVSAHMRLSGLLVHETREPSNHAIGRLIRETEGLVSPLAFATLIAADRYEHLSVEIRPALRDGKVVVCDRYLASSLALQSLDGVAIDQIGALNQWVPHPDVHVLLKAPADVLERRLCERPGRSQFEARFSRHQEVEAFRHAATILKSSGATVLELDTLTWSIDECVKAIVDAVGIRPLGTSG